jgi:hypothetical protein
MRPLLLLLVLTALVGGGFVALKFPTLSLADQSAQAPHEVELRSAELNPISTSKETWTPATGNPVELGDVRWIRHLDSATQVAKATGKPILILFQEVPGCSNCTRYGSVVLRHPLLVEAIETYFVPLCIYNNNKGADAEALQRFGEPAWNNPVVRIIRADGLDLTPRMADFRSAAALTNGIRAALRQQNTAVPAYLDLLSDEQEGRERGLSTATFSMYCFWSGEAALGQLEGVISTASGFQDGREVVKVEYDSTVIQYADFQRFIEKNNITACSRNTGFRADSEPKYHLSRTIWRGVPMTSVQACRANSAVGKGLSPERYLSPRQVALHERLTNKQKVTNYIGQTDITAAWKQAQLSMR